jgi:NADPH:quinone reductase-like Zn-dependent oxidoreductase
MKAIVYHSYGSADVLHYEEAEKPTPGDDEVLIRIRAACPNPMDYHLMKGAFVTRPMTGLRKPKAGRPGADLAGEVEAVGANVTRFKPGDPVFGAARNGSFAEYVSVKEKNLAPKPANLSFEQAAAIPVAGLTALQGLRDKGRIQSGQKVLINGASGGVGTFAVQIAKSFGAEVTGVCSTRNLELVRSIGAAHVIDYTREDFTRSTLRYDLLFDCIGNHRLSACRGVMSRKGTYVLVGVRPGGENGPLTHLLKVLMLSPFASQRLVFFIASMRQPDLLLLKELTEAGKVTPVIDRRYDLSEAAEAIRYLEEGHARGKVIVIVEHHEESKQALK